ARGALRTRPRRDPPRTDTIADEVACDFNTVTAHIHDRPATRKLFRPKPVAVRTAVSLARTRQQHFAKRTPSNCLQGLQSLGWIDQIFQITMEHTSLLHSFKHFQCFWSTHGEWLGA